ANLRSKPSSRSFMLLMASLRVKFDSLAVNMCVVKAQTKRSRAGQYASSHAALRHFSPESG
ncbi:hypothetical protein, partial [Mesorhizobium sp. M7A.F.Ca.CA.002.15.1.1]|uniref:hypothetical protein n=1 Tax=Mesorhizobium sp. M7A.F.Ca.CA.002.15.1.1 TaxID=2496717 RepID=UPI0019D2B12B